MKKLILILLIAVMLTLTLGEYKEYFKPDVVSDIIDDTYVPYNILNPRDIYHSRPMKYKSVLDKSKKLYESDLLYNDPGVEYIKCCLIEKKYLHNKSDISKVFQEQIDYGNRYQYNIDKITNDEKYLDNSNFEYTYKKLENDMCDPKLYNLDVNKQLFREGENDWNNNMCQPKNKSKKTGSCRYANKECIDYIDKKTCKKINLQWSEKTCQQPLDFVFVDKVKFKIPKFGDDGGKVNLFPNLTDTTEKAILDKGIKNKPLIDLAFEK